MFIVLASNSFSLFIALSFFLESLYAFVLMFVQNLHSLWYWFLFFIQHIKTYKYFDISNEDFEKFQNIFARYDIKSHEYALEFVKTSDDVFDRKYTDDEIKSIFDLDCEYSGIDKEISKDKVVNYSDREKSKKELTEFIKSGKTISKKSVKNLLKILEAFKSYECEIN